MENILRLLLATTLIVSLANGSLHFDLPSSPASPPPDLRTDANGRVYVSAGSQLFRLNDSLQLEESRELNSEAVNISLSTDGRWLVVCLTDLSCEVYNATNLADQPVFRRDNVVSSTDNMALFAAEDSFYIGSTNKDENDTQQQIVLSHLGLYPSAATSETVQYNITQAEFERNFHSGFIAGGNTYYFAIDSNPAGRRGLRVIRTCHRDRGDFNAVYELTLGCGGVAPTSNTRISGVSLIEQFAGLPGRTVVLSRNRPRSIQNYICLYSLDVINDVMERKYNSCSSAGNESMEQISLAWMDRMHRPLCNTFEADDMCQFTHPQPLVLSDVDNEIYNVDFRISVGTSDNPHFITASTVAVVESLSLVFLAFVDGGDDAFVIGFSIDNTTSQIFEDSGFDKTFIPSGPVRQLEWLPRTDYIIAVTDTSVVRLPVANCSSHTDCTGCLSNGNPLCGWCAVEGRCSRRDQCSGHEARRRWIQASGQNADQCLAISSISPQQYIVDHPQTVTLTLSQSLPDLTAGEEFLCVLSTGDGGSFTVEIVGSDTSFACNITDRIAELLSEEILTVVNVSVISSLFGVPFIAASESLEVYNCGARTSCSGCLKTSSVCGWCVYNKVCSGTPTRCINGSDNFLRLDEGQNQEFTEVCPILEPGSGYLLRVPTDRNIELVTRNLPPEVDGFEYKCVVNDIQLPAIYNDPTSLTCSVRPNQLLVSSSSGQEIVPVSIHWVGQSSMGELINHRIDNVTAINVTLYNCAELAKGCSSCTSFRLVEGFQCGWCLGLNSSTDSCNFIEDCSNNFISDGLNCPPPVITDFNPKSGPIEGGTTITITGRELGVTFDDFSPNSITVGNVPCTLVNESYIPGRQILCMTGRLTSVTNAVLIRLHSEAITAHQQFEVHSPKVYRVSPQLGPAAGGTRLTIQGADLDIGNVEDTRVTVDIGGGMECRVEPVDVMAESITCVTEPLSEADSAPASGSILVSIDNAVIGNSSTQFRYTLNPEFNRVAPSNTIPSGGIQLIFEGTNLDVAQQPLLVVDDANYLNTTKVTTCVALSSSSLSCLSPSLDHKPLGGDQEDNFTLSYTLVLDNAPGPNLSVESLQIRVLSDPGSFTLLTTEYEEEQSPFIARIAGDSLDSVLPNEIRVTVGGRECIVTSVQLSATLSQVYCIPPATPPVGISMATVKVFVGQNLEFTLNETLNYRPNDGDLLILSLTIVIATCVLLAVSLSALFLVCLVIRNRRERRRIKLNDQPSQYNRLVRVETNSRTALLFADESIQKQLPAVLIIPNNQLQIFDRPIGQGEFGVVYEGRLSCWRWYQRDTPVAVKRVKGLHSAPEVTNMLAEIAKMEDLRHPNVMSLIGVHLDMRTGLSIVMPFMANGNLLEYLKRERSSIYLDDSAAVDKILAVNKLLQRMCHQIVKGMEYLALRKFVHRDLAARNCMLDSLGNIKVGDFGLTEDVYVRGYFRQDKYDAIKVPFRWMAPESLRDGLFSEKSDVWSFGVTCWEVFSAGRIPYPAVDVMNILQLHEKGTRLEKPANAACSPEDFSIMVRCWALDPEDRPTFKELNTTMDELLQTAQGYAEFKMTLIQPREITEVGDPGYQVIANHFTEDQRGNVASRSPCVAGSSQFSNSDPVINPWQQEDHGDLINNDAYGNAMIDMGLVFSQEMYRDYENSQCYPNKSAMTVTGSSASLSTDL